MSAIKVDFGEQFIKDLDRLEQDYPGVQNEVEALISELERGQRPGDKIPRVRRDVYKVRLKNPAAKRGKRGGFRAIYYVQVAEQIYLVTLYSKTKQEDISPQKLRKLIDAL